MTTLLFGAAMSQVGSKAALTAKKSDFSFTSESGLKSDIAGGPFRAKSGSGSDRQSSVAQASALLRNSRRGVQYHQPTPIPLFVHVGREGREAYGIPALGLALNTFNSDNPPHVLREMDLRLFHRHRNLGEAIESPFPALANRIPSDNQNFAGRMHGNDVGLSRPNPSHRIDVAARNGRIESQLGGFRQPASAIERSCRLARL
jgi:hypothetical protein